MVMEHEAISEDINRLCDEILTARNQGPDGSVDLRLWAALLERLMLKTQTLKRQGAKVLPDRLVNDWRKLYQLRLLQHPNAVKVGKTEDEKLLEKWSGRFDGMMLDYEEHQRWLAKLTNSSAIGDNENAKVVRA